MNLPEPCEKCFPFGGSWMEGPTGGMQRCECPRGMALSATAKPQPQPPVISTEEAMMCVGVMSVTDFFPSDPIARGVIANEIASLCESLEKAKWLATRMSRLYQKWPGIVELRRVYCSAHQPLDALPAIGISEVYPDGIPPDNPATEPVLQISGVTSASPSIASTVSDLAAKTDLSRALRTSRPVRVREIPIERPVPITELQRRTIQADIDRILAKKRELQARKDIGLDPA